MQRGAPEKARAGPATSSAPKVNGSAGYPNAASTLANAPTVQGKGGSVGARNAGEPMSFYTYAF